MTSALHSLAGGPKLRVVGSALAVITATGVLGACGSSSHSSSASSSTAAGSSSAGSQAKPSAVVQIKHNWTAFFAASTPAAKKASLLEHGQAFSQVIAAQSKSPLASQSQANVSKVEVTGPDRARVTYTILLAGKPALKNQTGTAVKSGGTWKVSDASFCSLLALEGSRPANCPKG